MFRRLLFVVGFLVLTSCAKPPVAELESARETVARAYAAGASALAQEKYDAAADFLQDAERLVREGHYRTAQYRLERAKEYAEEALKLTAEHKKRLLQEQQRRQQQLAEEKTKQEAVAKPAPKPSPPVIKAAPKAAEKETSEAPQEPELVDHVEVTGGETLADIAARDVVYNDALLWPLIYKANRDQIKDPKEIYPGQVLVIPRNKSVDEREAARQEARELNIF